MLKAAEALEFERAAELRDRIRELQEQSGQPAVVDPRYAAVKPPQKARGRKQRRRVPRPKKL